MSNFVDYYELLGVERQASRTEIEEAVRATRKRYRRLEGSPDQAQRANAERMMALLAEAEKTLLNTTIRPEYDAAYDREKQRIEDERKRADSSGEHDWVSDAMGYLDEKNYTSALFAATEATRQHPEDPTAWGMRALASINLNRYEEAEYASREILKIDPVSVSALDILSESCLQLEQYDEAIMLSRRAQELDSGDDEYPCKIVRALFLQGNHKNALAEARKAVAAFPKSEQAERLLRNCLIQDAENSMSKQAGSLYFTNVRQIEHVQQILMDIQRLSSSDEDTEQWISEMNGLLDHAQGRHYAGAPTWYWVMAGFFGLCIIAGAAANPIPWIVLAVLIAYGVKAVWPYGWETNAKLLGSAATNSGLQ